MVPGPKAIAAAMVLSALPAGGVIVRRADRPDSRYLELGARFPAVVRLGRLGDATLVAPRWLLTAGHIGNAMTHGRPLSAVRIGPKEYAITEVVVHPAWHELGPSDIALVRLGSAVTGVAPITLFRGTHERGRIAILVGHGGAGVGTDRVRTEDGRARAATSRVDSVDSRSLYFSFDEPPKGTDLEGAPGPGDSGGPALVTVGERVEIAGVSSAGYDERFGPTTYGAVDVFSRVSRFARWIDSVERAPWHSADANSRQSTSPQSDTLPDTVPGRRFLAFLRALTAGTDSAIVAFLTENFDEHQLKARPAQERLPNFRRLTALLTGAKIKTIVESTPVSVTVRLALAGGGTATLQLLCSERAPNKVVDWRRFD